MFDAQTLADRYVAVWNELDATTRLSAIAALWAPGAPRQGLGALGKLILGSSEKTAGATAFAFARLRAPESAAMS